MRSLFHFFKQIISYLDNTIPEVDVPSYKAAASRPQSLDEWSIAHVDFKDDFVLVEVEYSYFVGFSLFD